MVSTIAEEGPDRIHCLTTAAVWPIDLSHAKSPPLPRMTAPPREKGGATFGDGVTERDDFDS
jgi:hypothetical protein